MSTFLCGFGKKSRKEEPYSIKPSKNKPGHGKSKDNGPQSKEKTKEQQSIIHTHITSSDKKQGGPGANLYPDKTQDKTAVMSDDHKKTATGDLQNGGHQGVPDIRKEVTGQDSRGNNQKKEEVDGNWNKTYQDNTGPIVIESFQEAQDIDRLTEQIMSGDKITSLDITGKNNMYSPPRDILETHVSHPVQVQNGKAIPISKSDEKEKEYITAEKMVADDFYYKMNNHRRGTCIIINVGEFLPITGMLNRNGYLVDGELMKGTFSRLGFDVKYVKNPTNLKLKRALEEVSLSDHTDVDCLAVVIMSHGNRDRGDVIFTKDGIMQLDFIIEFFNGQCCPQLAGKPKLFFVQACRGDKLDQGQEVPFIDEDVDEMDAAMSAPKIPIEADILLSQATAPGYISFRNSQKGSIYIRCLTKALAEHAYDEDILSILTRVNAMVAFEFESNSVSKMEYHAKKQMPTFTCQLTRKLQFTEKKGKKG